MTFAEVSAKHHNPVRTLRQCIHDEFGMHHARAHYPNDPHIMGILHPGSPGEIGCGVRAPVAAEGNNFRLKTHVIYSFYLKYTSRTLSDPANGERMVGAERVSNL